MSELTWPARRRNGLLFGLLAGTAALILVALATLFGMASDSISGQGRVLATNGVVHTNN